MNSELIDRADLLKKICETCSKDQQMICVSAPLCWEVRKIKEAKAVQKND